MSASSDLQEAVTALLRGSPALRVPVEVLARRRGEMASEIEAAAANHGLCCYVMPPLPLSALQGTPELFFPKAELRVQTLEVPATNATGADAYDLLDDLLVALHGQPHKGIEGAVAARMTSEGEDLATATAWAREQPELRAHFALFDLLAYPLYAARRPAAEAGGRGWRRVDAIFTAVYGIRGGEAFSI